MAIRRSSGLPRIARLSDEFFESAGIEAHERNLIQKAIAGGKLIRPRNLLDAGISPATALKLAGKIAFPLLTDLQKMPGELLRGLSGFDALFYRKGLIADFPPPTGLEWPEGEDRKRDLIEVLVDERWVRGCREYEYLFLEHSGELKTQFKFKKWVYIVESFWAGAVGGGITAGPIGGSATAPTVSFRVMRYECGTQTVFEFCRYIHETVRLCPPDNNWDVIESVPGHGFWMVVEIIEPFANGAPTNMGEFSTRAAAAAFADQQVPQGSTTTARSWGSYHDR